MSEGCLLEGHRRQIAAMDVAKTLRDAIQIGRTFSALALPVLRS